MTVVAVAKRTDPLTGATRRVEGNQRMLTGNFLQPGNKYVTGGYEVTPAALGFDTRIERLLVVPEKAAKVLVGVERISDTLYQVRFYSALGEELANDSETMKERGLQYIAWGT